MTGEISRNVFTVALLLTNRNHVFIPVGSAYLSDAKAYLKHARKRYDLER